MKNKRNAITSKMIFIAFIQYTYICYKIAGKLTIIVKTNIV